MKNKTESEVRDAFIFKMSRTFAKSVDFLELFFEQRFKLAHFLLLGAEKSTKVSKRRLVQILLILNIGTLALCCWSKVTKLAVLYFYPIRGTFICLQEGNPEEAVRWLMYWIVFGTIQCFFGIVEQFIGFLSFLNYVLVIWAFLPLKYNGTNIIYKKVIRPIHQQLLDTSFDTIGVNFIEFLTKKLKCKLS